ncbi:sodium:proton antiporter [Caldanaerobacter subterraneus]|uniref:Cation:proton antiporter subunit C n=2 Tax=Caldanaerobacter subterraneus TaxID=911092 RepID=A0A7Y2L9K4_9THEO|nr:cation:proton antiporter subunit C [Caldanaerobacter subterraneus]NNG68150.1 cation:proton antiporter subunit C [Caldanaerobacter subterraneus]
MMQVFILSSLSLMFIGLYGVLTRKNLLKIIIALNIIETGINLLLVSFGYIDHGITPILTSQESILNLNKMVDPVPQALVLTSIVIGLGTTAFALALAIRYKITHNSISINASEEEEGRGI